MALESPEDCTTLRKRVTSPGGTTERAIGILEQGDLRGLFATALSGARDRARELADQFGKA
jgi:pyrroline-5-carboxylate reductase